MVSSPTIVGVCESREVVKYVERIGVIRPLVVIELASGAPHVMNPNLYSLDSRFLSKTKCFN